MSQTETIVGLSKAEKLTHTGAEIVAERSVAIDKKNVHCISNLGVSQLNLRKFSEALDTLRYVTEAMPQSGPSWHNFGLALYMVGRYTEALTAFNRAIEILGDSNPHLLSDKGLCLLSLGNIQEGLAAYEIRWKLLYRNIIWNKGIAEWQGEPIRGKRLLVHHEQGFGDSLMLVRFVNSLQEKGAEITLAVPEELRQLFEDNFPLANVITLEEEEIDSAGPYDFHSPLLSVMRWLGIKSPKEISGEPYLAAVPDFPMKLPEGFRVGLCWASGNHGPAHTERRRVAQVTSFLPLLLEGNVSLISLQKGREVGDLAANGLEGLVFDTSMKLNNFADTAALIASLDAVITVDSAVAHLAGAMAKPTVMLSPYTRCWRWWGWETGWPWYTRMHVISQSPDGTWDDAAHKAVRAVARMVKRHEGV